MDHVHRISVDNALWVCRSPQASTSYSKAKAWHLRDLQRARLLPITEKCFTTKGAQSYSCSSRGRRRVLHCIAPSVESVTVREGVENVVIVGSGPAGYTAAIYAARANLKPVVFEGLQVAGVRGGQLMTTNEVENFPGFPEGITGPDLMDKMRAQAERWGSELLTEDVEAIDLSTRPFTIRTSEVEVKANSLILATGAAAKRLGLPSEEKYWSRGISACAICDGSSPIYKQQELAVVGGGDTAAEEAVYLTKYGRKVHLLVRGGRMRASAAMQDRVLNHPAVQVHLNTGVEDAHGDAKGMNGLDLVHTQTGEKSKLKVRGLFYGIGHQPNSSLVAGQIELDDAGYVKVHDGVKTSMEGVFAAGDLFDTEWRQAVTAAGSGCMAALSAERFLNENELIQEFHQRGQENEKVEASKKESATTEEVDLGATKHRGQIALRKLYHESDRVLLVLYTSPTCGPCRTLKPIVNAVTDEFDGDVHLVEINIEEDGEVAAAAGVNGTPTVQLFKNKALVQHLPGVKMKRDYRNFILEAKEAKKAVRA